MNSCCHYVDIQSVDSLIALTPKMKEITRYFNSLYPDDYYNVISNCDAPDTLDLYYIKSFKLSIVWKKEESIGVYNETASHDDGETEEEMKKECMEYKKKYGEEFKALSKSIGNLSRYTILVKNVEKPMIEFGEHITVNKNDAVPERLRSLIQAWDNESSKHTHLRQRQLSTMPRRLRMKRKNKDSQIV